MLPWKTLHSMLIKKKFNLRHGSTYLSSQHLGTRGRKFTEILWKAWCAEQIPRQLVCGKTVVKTSKQQQQQQQK